MRCAGMHSVRPRRCRPLRMIFYAHFLLGSSHRDIVTGKRGDGRGQFAAAQSDERDNNPAANGHANQNITMESFLQALGHAFRLIASGDPTLTHIVLLSLAVSLSAVVLATLLGLPLGAALAVGRFPGRRGLVVLLHALMGLPPVVGGLF